MISLFSSALRRSFASSAAMEETILRPCNDLHSKFSCFPARDEVAGGRGPEGESELEAGVEETAGDDLAALQDELRFGAHEEGADLDHPRSGGQADAGAPGFADRAQEVAIGKRIGGGEIDDAGEIFVWR